MFLFHSRRPGETPNTLLNHIFNSVSQQLQPTSSQRSSAVSLQTRKIQRKDLCATQWTLQIHKRHRQIQALTAGTQAWQPKGAGAPPEKPLVETRAQPGDNSSRGKVPRLIS